MPRVKRVKSARKPQGTCGRCQDDLPAGAPYVWWKFRYGGKRVRCTKPGCGPRPSDLTQSKLSIAYAACEAVADLHLEVTTIGGAGSPTSRADWSSDAESYIDEAKNSIEDIRAVGEEYVESADAMDEVAEGGSMAVECREKAEEIESFCDECECALDEIDQDPEDDDEKAEDYAERIMDEVQSAFGPFPL